MHSLAQSISSDIHPLNNLRVLKYLQSELGASDEQKNAWYQHWVMVEFDALEKRLSTETQTAGFCHGDAPTLADVCLVPQVFNARRFEVDMSRYPTIERIAAACEEIDAFARAVPSAQPDAGS